VAPTYAEGTQLFGYPILGKDEDLAGFFGDYTHALIAVGQIKTPEHRIRLFKSIKKAGFSMPTIISRHAYVSDRATLGEGTIVMHGAIINAGATVGCNCIVNSHSLIEHDAVVSDHCHISTASVINGDVMIGEGSFVGSGSIVREAVKVGKRCVIGMGQRVLSDCVDGARVSMQERLL